MSRDTPGQCLPPVQDDIDVNDQSAATSLAYAAATTMRDRHLPSR